MKKYKKLIILNQKLNSPEEDGINKFLENIKAFGNIYINDPNLVKKQLLPSGKKKGYGNLFG